MPEPKPVRFKFWRRSAILVLLLIGGGFCLDKIFPLDLSRFNDRSPILLDKNGNLLSVLLAKDERFRLTVSVEEVDPKYIQQLIHYEDKRYYYHFGIDPFALIRALWQWGNSGKVISGGSTLTLQTVRLLEPRSRTLVNKCIEFLRAIQLECHFSKKTILEMYLSLAPYGGNIEGIRAASISYFGKEPKTLTPAEAALLVVLPQQPTRLRPFINPALAKAHRDKVLKRMQKIKILDEKQTSEAMQDGIPEVKQKFPQLARHLAQRLNAEAPLTKVHPTYIDSELQTKVEQLLNLQTQFLDPQQSMAALVVDNKTRAVVAYVGSADFKNDMRCGQVDMISAIRSPGSTLKPFIYALGFEEQMIHPDTIIQDVPTSFSGYAPNNFKDIFHGSVSIREALQQSLNVPAVAVLERIGAGRFAGLLRDLGVTLKFKNENVNPSLPLALGGVGTKLSDLVSLYSALANEGKFAPLLYTRSKTADKLANSPDESSNSVIASRSKASTKQSSKTSYHPRESGDPIQNTICFVNKDAAYIVKEILEAAPLPSGFVDQIATRSQPIAYKTGTSYGFRDALAVGFNDKYTIGIWVGRPDGTPCLDQTGRTHAAPTLFKVFSLLPNSSETQHHEHSSQVALAAKKSIPKHLIEFKSKQNSQSSENNLKILFPKEGTTLNVDDNLNSIPISFSGGKPPYYYFENDKPLEEVLEQKENLQASSSNAQHKFQWKPKNLGFWELTIVDSEGNSASSTIKVAE